MKKNKNKNKKISIGFLFDKKNQWIYQFFKKIKIQKEISNKFKVSSSFSINNLRKCKIIFILGYTKLINIKKINSFEYALIVHESDLPKGRGFSPVRRQIVRNKNKIKVLLIKCSKRADTGDIVENEMMQIQPFDLYDDIREKQFLATKRIIIKFLKKYPNIKSKKQKGKSTFFKKLRNLDDKLSLNKSIKDQFNILRSTDYKNYPNYFYYKGKKFYIRISKK